MNKTQITIVLVVIGLVAMYFAFFRKGKEESNLI